MSVLDELKSAIKAKLPELDMVIGWEQGFDPLRATPLFMRSEADVDKLTWGPLNVQNNATYLTGLKGKKVGVVVKGCDSRSVVELLQEKLLNRDDIFIFGAPCSGTVDLAKIRQAAGNLGLVRDVELSPDSLKLTMADGTSHTLKLADALNDKCGRCRFHNAVLSDVFVGDKLPPSIETDTYEDVTAFEALSLGERFDHWQQEMNRCLRCYACRNACPMCVCRDHCVAQSRDPHWISQADEIREKWLFQVIHALHLAGRCTECGECQRACPVDIPILAMKRKLNKEMKELFGYEAGLDVEATPPLLSFKIDEDNINERGW